MDRMNRKIKNKPIIDKKNEKNYSKNFSKKIS